MAEDRIELKPCPFCGGIAKCTSNNRIQCDECGGLAHKDTWNTRAAAMSAREPDALPAELPKGGTSEARIHRLEEQLAEKSGIVRGLAMLLNCEQDGEVIITRLDDLISSGQAIRTPAAVTAAAGDGQGQPRWRHKKSGGAYVQVGRAEYQHSDVRYSLGEGDTVVVYRGADGKLWARQEDEFDDGRFERLPDAQPPAVPQEKAEGTWLPISTAAEDPDKLIEVYAPDREGLGPVVCLCRWHPDAGFTVCELRHVTHWRPHSPPAAEESPR